MTSHNRKPITFLNHPHQLQLRRLLFKLFDHPNPQSIAKATAHFLRQSPLPLDDFPRVEGTYSRTIAHRSSNGFEAMAARWSKGATTTIHGHPSFVFYYVVKGNLKIDNYRRNDAGVTITSSEYLGKDEYFFSIGKSNTFDNHIHQVRANVSAI